jgi:putrescine transport system substrate-binding protein
VIWQTQKWSSGNYKGREKLVDAAGLREAQTLLGKLGFDPGPLDATFGPQTQVATEAFQESQQVTVDGLITATVLMNLRRAVGGAGAGAKATVRVLNWPDYIEPSVLQDFEKETGIRVVYDVFAGNDDLQAKLAAGGVPYDVVFPTANAVPAMAAKGLLGKLDKTSLKNIGNLDPRVDATLRAWDKDGAYSLPYMWYTVGIAWNPKLTAKAAPGQAMDALANVFDADTARRFQSCGVGVVDSASDVVPLAAMAGGVSQVGQQDLGGGSQQGAGSSGWRRQSDSDRPVHRPAGPRARSAWRLASRATPCRRNPKHAAMWSTACRQTVACSPSTPWQWRPTPRTSARHTSSSTTCCARR